MKKTPAADLLNVPKVLLVDDNRDGLIVRKSLLEEIGYHVETAETGARALELCGTLPFDVVVTDYRMPCMTGSELIECLRRNDPNTLIIMLSGFVEPLGLTEQNTGADIVLAKSANEPVQLLRSIKRLLSHGAKRKPPASQKRPAKANSKAISC